MLLEDLWDELEGVIGALVVAVLVPFRQFYFVARKVLETRYFAKVQEAEIFVTFIDARLPSHSEK